MKSLARQVDARLEVASPEAGGCIIMVECPAVL
jgi:hypothetical protein